MAVEPLRGAVEDSEADGLWEVDILPQHGEWRHEDGWFELWEEEGLFSLSGGIFLTRFSQHPDG